MIVNVSIFYQNSGLTPSKLYYSNTRCHFCMNSVFPPIRAVLHLRKNPNVLYQNSDLTQSKFYYSNTINQFCLIWALVSLRAILHLRKNFKHCKKLVRFFLNTHLIKFFQFIKIWIQADQKSITVIRDISST